MWRCHFFHGFQHAIWSKWVNLVMAQCCHDELPPPITVAMHDRFLFLQNNAHSPTHTDLISMNFLEEDSINITNWSPHSLDMNKIELGQEIVGNHVWAYDQLIISGQSALIRSMLNCCGEFLGSAIMFMICSIKWCNTVVFLFLQTLWLVTVKDMIVLILWLRSF